MSVLRSGSGVLLSLFLVVTACGGGRAGADREFTVAQHLENGNTLYAGGDAEGARAEYRAAVAADPASAASWFGVFMASAALADSATAAEALRHVQRLAPDAEWRGHPQSPPKLPPDHPTLGGAP